MCWTNPIIIQYHEVTSLTKLNHDGKRATQSPKFIIQYETKSKYVHRNSPDA